jgi:hypothetical protein
MTTSLSGGCLCGAIRFHCDGPALASFACHCTACQKRTSSAFGTGILVQADKLVIEQGTTRTRRRMADSGNDIEMHFCGDCGTSLYAINSGRRHAHIVFTGALDDPSQVEIRMNVWTDSALPWVNLDNAECFPRSPNLSKRHPPRPE